MPHTHLHPHDVQLASFDGERAVLLAVWGGFVAYLRGVATRLGRGAVPLPGTLSPR